MRWLFALLMGLIFGALVSAYTDFSLLTLMRPMLYLRVSIVPMFVLAAFPFLMAAVAVMIKRYDLIFLLLLLRSFGYGFCAWSAVRIFTGAAWLVQPMLQFSDGIGLALLAGLSASWCHGHRNRYARDLLLCLILVIFAVILDCGFVAPVLAQAGEMIWKG